MYLFKVNSMFIKKKLNFLKYLFLQHAVLIALGTSFLLIIVAV